MFGERDLVELRVVRKVDSSTGDYETKYYWKDEPIQAIKLTGIRAERLAGLSLIQKDLANALAWVEEAASITSAYRGEGYQQIVDRTIGNRAKALFVAALVFYAKSFDSGEGRRAKLERADLDGGFVDQHDHFILVRNNLAAHSGAEKFESAESRVLFIPDEPRGFSLRLTTSRTQPDLIWSDEEGDRFTSLIKHAIEKVEERYDSLGKQIIQAAANKPPTYWISVVRGGSLLNVDELLQK
jgi:hypothetical protein